MPVWGRFNALVVDKHPEGDCGLLFLRMYTECYTKQCKSTILLNARNLISKLAY